MSREQRLEAALRRYGQHDVVCPLNLAHMAAHLTVAFAPSDCTCGLAAAVLGEQEAAPPEPAVALRLAWAKFVLSLVTVPGDPDAAIVTRAAVDRMSGAIDSAAAPQGEPEPPTWQQAEDVYGFDAMREPLRAAAPDRCDECGGLVKGFFANFLRRCPNDWHIVREEWEHGLGPAPQGEGNTDE